jgi:hypothetical protein
MRFSAADAAETVADNPNNRAITCDKGWNGWNYICTFLNGAELHRAGFVLSGPGGSPLLVGLPATGPVPAPHR